uniref:RNA-binding protein Musashi homolog 2 n=1 Tax=Cyprinus carpio TaxID=7962 RepID=A0A8C1PC35_CYPCA
MEGDGSQATSGSPNDSQHDPGKMFIGGLSWQTSPDSLRDYFSKFGEIRECMVMRDPTTKRSRGFGFVTFADAASVDKVLAQPHHELDSKTMVTRTKKIFVGGLSANTVVEDVKQYFEQFGKVEDAMLMFDKTTNRHRGKSPFVLCVYLFVPLRVCNVVRNVHQLYYAISCAVHSCTLKTLKREFSVAVQELLCCVLHYSIISSRTFHLSPEGQG